MTDPAAPISASADSQLLSMMILHWFVLPGADFHLQPRIEHLSRLRFEGIEVVTGVSGRGPAAHLIGSFEVGRRASRQRLLPCSRCQAIYIAVTKAQRIIVPRMSGWRM